MLKRRDGLLKVRGGRRRLRAQAIFLLAGLGIPGDGWS